jgi:hypothetical protein
MSASVTPFHLAKARLDVGSLVENPDDKNHRLIKPIENDMRADAEFAKSGLVRAELWRQPRPLPELVNPIT